MKKRLCYLFIIVLVLTCGCAHKESPEDENSNISVGTEKPETTSEEKAEPIAEAEIKTEETEEKTEEEAEEEVEEEVEESANIFDLMPEEYFFSSGAGGWGTSLHLSADGSFEGCFSDSDMGVTGEGYPGGTLYLSEFTGQFAAPIQVSEYIYETSVEKLEWDRELEDEIIDDILHIYTEPYGLVESAKIRIYLPGTPIRDVDEEFMDWSFLYSEERKYLPEGYYGIYNVTEGFGFIGIADDCLWNYQYAGSTGCAEASLSPGYYSSYFSVRNEEEGIHLSFDWADDDQIDFEIKDWFSQEEYQLHLEFQEERSKVTAVLTDKSGKNLESLGGTKDGVLTVELNRK